MMQYRPLQPALPTGFDSWAQVLTDWRVSRAFDASPFPRCFRAEPELAVAFVAEISRAICDRQLRRRPLELALRRESIVEPTFEQSGGPTYLALRDEMESAQDHYFASRHVHTIDDAPRSSSPLWAEVERLQAKFFATRQRHEPAATEAQRVTAQNYWKILPSRGLEDGFFADAPSNSVITRMNRIDPAWWWRSFFTRLQIECANHHAADGCFLDELPALRLRRGKKTLAAHIAEWCEARADKWGWDGPGHYRMLANRAGSKAESVRGWFDQRAPGYLSDATVRAAVHARLTELLALTDPLEKLLAAERAGLSEHWRN